jgi:phosphoglycolate phosphatase
MPNFKILHLAPERGIYNRLKNIISPENYVTADFDPSRYGFSRARKIDLTQMDEWKSNEFDLIIHIHVMEHVPCNLAYSFFHLHRMLKDGGKHMFIIPILDGVYDECFDKISDEERTLRFGQYDHVRKFGRDGLLMTLGKFINLPDSFDATNDFSEELLLNSNIPKPYWKGMHGGTVFTLEKDSYKLK